MTIFHFKMGRTKRKRKRRTCAESRNKNVSTSDTNIRLLKWMKTHSSWEPTCLLELTEFSPLGLRGLMAKHNININDTIVRIPIELLVTRELASSHISSSKVLKGGLKQFDYLTTLELLVIFLLITKKEARRNKEFAMFWKPYLDTFPSSYDVPFFCADDEVNKI